MAKPDPKGCPHLKARVWGEEGLPEPAPPFPPSLLHLPQGVTFAFSRTGRGRVELISPLLGYPGNPHLRGRTRALICRRREGKTLSASYASPPPRKPLGQPLPHHLQQDSRPCRRGYALEV